MKYIQILYVVILSIGVVFSFCYILYIEFTKPRENGKKRLNKHQISHKGILYTVPKEIYWLCSEQIRQNHLLQAKIKQLENQLQKK